MCTKVLALVFVREAVSGSHRLIDVEHVELLSPGNVPLVKVGIFVNLQVKKTKVLSMGCPHNLVNGRGPKVNTAKHSSEKGEDGTHPPLSHYCA